MRKVLIIASARRVCRLVAAQPTSMFRCWVARPFAPSLNVSGTRKAWTRDFNVGARVGQKAWTL